MQPDRDVRLALPHGGAPAAGPENREASLANDGFQNAVEHVPTPEKDKIRPPLPGGGIKPNQEMPGAERRFRAGKKDQHFPDIWPKSLISNASGMLRRLQHSSGG